MKRCGIALLLCLSLLFASASPALASKAAEEALTQITLQVKKTLDISDDYTDFYSDFRETGSQTWWELNWEQADAESLSVQTDGTGKIFSYYRFFYHDDRSYSYSSSLDPHFPAFSPSQAQAAAEAFLAQVLTEGEGFSLDPVSAELRPRYSRNLSGSLTLNGLPTGIGFSIQLRSDDLTVLRFERYDLGMDFSGETPSPLPELDGKTALERYRSCFTPTLHYIVTDWESKTASLVYSISRDTSMVLDAHSGKLLPHYERFDQLAAPEAPAPATGTAEADMDKGGLTEAELSGIAKLEGLLSAQDLRQAAQQETAFGVTDAYVMGPVSYQLVRSGAEAEPEQAQASFSLTLTLRDGDPVGYSDEAFQALLAEGYTPSIRKSFTLDARSGEVLNLYTSYSGFGWRGYAAAEPTAEPELSQTALRFLQKQYPDYFPKAALHRTSSLARSVGGNSFSYCQQVEGHPYEGNSFSVTVNAATGTVDSFSCYWDEEIVFEPAGTPVSPEAALDAWLGCYQPELEYASLSVKTEDADDNLFARYLVFDLATAEGESPLYVLASSAKVVKREVGEAQPELRYEALEGWSAPYILELAEFGIGFYDCDFAPRQQLTELDLLLFLLSAGGSRFSQPKVWADENLQRQVYDMAWSYDLLPRDQQEPTRLVTRVDLCRSFVVMAGMQKAAELSGIFRCDFSDEADIAARDYGYVAIAKGLGLVQGDAEGSFRPNAPASRQELAVLLHHYMSR